MIGISACGMVKTRDLNDAVLAGACGPRALQAGTLYQRQGRVTEVVVEENGRRITARVQGNETRPYRQTIAIEEKTPGRIVVSGECTCPVGFNCKHVAAAIVAARDVGGRTGSVNRAADWGQSSRRAIEPPPGVKRISAPASQPQAGLLSASLVGWLDSLGAAELADSEDYPAEVHHRLVYLLDSHASGDRHPVLVVRVFKVRLRKDGTFGDDSQPFDLRKMSANPPKFVRPSDLANAKRMLMLSSEYSSKPSFLLADAAGADLLPFLLATGRTRWRSLDGPVMSSGPSLDGRLDWSLGEDARQRPVIVLAGENHDGLITLRATPPVWVDPASGQIGQIETGLNRTLAAVVLAAPPIAPGDAPVLAEAIQKKGAHLAALAPRVPEMEETLGGSPLPVLRLQAATLPVEPLTGSGIRYGWTWPPATETVGIARAAFLYDDIELAAEDTRPQPILARRGRLVKVKRDLRTEAARLKRLSEFDLVAVAKARPGAASTHGSALVPLEADAGWLDFLWHDKAKLEAEGWRVIIAADFPVRLAMPETGLQARLRESSGIDWLELDLGVVLDGETVDLVPALVALILSPAFEATLDSLQTDDEDLPFYLPLNDGRVLGLPAARMQPILATLAALLLHQGSGKPRLTAADAAALDALEQAGVVFRGGDNLRALGRRLREHGGIADVVPPPWFSAELRPYQARGLAWLQLLAQVGLGGILADDMGLGKTVQTLAHIAVEKAAGRLDRPALVIAPTSLVGNWVREAERFAPELALLVLHGLDRRKDFDRIGAADLVITTYPLIARDHETLVLRDWSVIVLDEAQAIKNPEATTTKLVAKLSARQKLCLSGTPLENHLGELWSLFHFANPGFLGDAGTFRQVYRTPIEKKGDGERARLLARRVRPFTLRRTKAEVAPELPAKTEMAEAIELGTAQRDVYETIRMAMHEKVKAAIAAKGFAQSRIIILDALLKLRQATCDPRLLKLANGKQAKAGSAKLERLMEMLEELLAEGRRILVFSQFTSMLALIEERLTQRGIDYALLTGDSKNRPAIIARFQDGDVPVFLVSLKAGGTGLNLTAADTVILYDPWWNPAVEDQAIDRAHRIGQHKPVFVYRLVAQGTIEDKMETLKDKKRALAAGLFDAEGVPTLAMTEADIELLLA
jgi:superfamily II DNA or RNA helicase